MQLLPYVRISSLWAISSPLPSNAKHAGKNSADDILKYYSYFSQKTGFTFMQIVSLGYSLYEVSNPIFWEK